MEKDGAILYLVDTILTNSCLSAEYTGADNRDIVVPESMMVGELYPDDPTANDLPDKYMAESFIEYSEESPANSGVNLCAEFDAVPIDKKPPLPVFPRNVDVGRQYEKTLPYFVDS